MRAGGRRGDTILPRLIATIVAAVTAVSVVFIYPIIFVSGVRLVRSVEESAALTADRLAESLAIPVWNFVAREIEVQLELSMSDPNAVSASLAFRDSLRPAITVSRGGPAGAPAGTVGDARHLIVERREVSYQERAIGDLELKFTRALVERRVVDNALLQMAFLAVLDVALIVPLLFLLRAFIILPLRRIEHWAAAVSLGDLTPLPEGKARGEIASLRGSISRMVGLLGERYDAMVAREREYRSLFESSPVATWELDFSPLKGELSASDRVERRHLDMIRVRGANEAALRPLGLSSPAERVVDILGITDETLALLAAEAESLRSGSPGASGEVVLARPGGERRTYAVRFAVLAGHEEDWSRVIATAADLTDRAAAEADLRCALAEKESLLQELFHRTRNSLQLMASFISLRAQRARDDSCALEFRELERRIRTLALAQEQLIRSGDLSQVDLGVYLRDVLSTIAAEASGPVGRVVAAVEAGPLPTLIDAAIPIGLIAAELASNSIAHAFPGERSGVISAFVERRGDGTIALSMRDDGVGPPSGFDPRRDASLGLETVYALAERQLGGTIGFDFSAGFRCDLSFDDGIFERRV
jgi:two-component sensor histidine kinase